MTNVLDFVVGENKAQKKRAKAINAVLARMPPAKVEFFNRLLVSWRAARAADPLACAEHVLKYVQEQP